MNKSASKRSGRSAGRPSLVILLPVVWSVRNVVHAGVLRRLADSGINVHFLMAQWPIAEREIAGALDLERASSCGKMIQHRPATSRFDDLMDSVLKEAFYCRARMSSLRLGNSWLKRNAAARGRLRARFVRVAGTALGRPAIFRIVRSWYERRWLRRQTSGAIREQLAHLSPDAIWMTLRGLAGEDPYLAAARAMRIPTVTSIMGFDNPFTKGFRPRFDRYLVWNEFMKDAIIQLEPHLDRAAISITGTPQFDFHCSQELRWKRDTTLAKLGLPENGRYVLYAANHVDHTPDEPELLRRLVDHLSGDDVLGGHQVLVRLHPLDDSKRWEGAKGYRDRVVLCQPFQPPCDQRGWSISSLEDQGLLVNSLRHADACINIASTIALDAAILDRPVISLELSGEPDCPAGVYFAEYGSEYYQPLVKSGGLSMAHSWRELLVLLRKAVASPSEGRRQRQKMVHALCGRVDGKAADRVATELQAFVSNRSGRPSGVTP